MGQEYLYDCLVAWPVSSSGSRLLDVLMWLAPARRLALMKPTAVLVNVSRGGLVDTDAVVSTLQEGK